MVVRKGDKVILLEIWAGGRLLKELAVPEAQHGPLYNDGWFGVGAEWSSDESRIAYVAEVGYPDYDTPILFSQGPGKI